MRRRDAWALVPCRRLQCDCEEGQATKTHILAVSATSHLANILGPLFVASASPILAGLMRHVKKQVPHAEGGCESKDTVIWSSRQKTGTYPRPQEVQQLMPNRRDRTNYWRASLLTWRAVSDAQVLPDPGKPNSPKGLSSAGRKLTTGRREGTLSP